MKTKTCAECKKAKSVASFKPDERHDDKLADLCWGCTNKNHEARSYAEAEPALETVTLTGVEVFSSGGPYHGTNSPPEGDYYTADEIDEIVAANKALAHELYPANKIGHSKEQALAENSGYVTEGEMPGLGWLTNVRAMDGDDGERKIVVDVEGVPKKFASLIRKRLYRTKSVELSRVKGQKGKSKGKTYSRVVTGLAWLGGKMPAVRSLSDVVEMFAEGTIVWNPDEGFESVRTMLNVALNPSPPGAETPSRYWVSDVADGRCLVNDYSANKTWVVEFSRDGDSVTIDDASDWTPARPAWVEAAASYAAANASRNDPEPAADTSSQMDFTDKQIDDFAAGFEIVEDDPAKRREAVAAKFDELTGEPEKPEAETPPVETPVETPPVETPAALPAEFAAEFAVLRQNAEQGAKAAKALFQERRTTLVDEYVAKRCVPPAERDFWLTEAERDYDATGNLEHTETLLSKLIPDPALSGATGYDDDGLSTESQLAAEDAAYAEYAAQTNVKEGSATGA